MRRKEVLLLLVVLALGGVILDQTDYLQSVEGVVVAPLALVQSGMSFLVSGARELIDTARDVGELRRRNEELQGENDRLTIENVRLKEVEAQYATLCDLLDFVQANPSYSHRAAQVIGRDPGNIARSIILDVGRGTGVTRGMPVVTDRGLVGRVTAVGPNWARVLPITDISSSTNALIQGSRASGIVVGQVGGGLLLRYLPQGAEVVHVGDIVLTSGLGGNFPKGLVIGQVTAVHQRDVEIFQEAVVRPTADFNRLEMVLVITDFEPPDLEE